MSAPTDDGLCEWCSELNNGSTYSPFCSMECEIEAEMDREIKADEAAGVCSKCGGDGLVVVGWCPDAYENIEWPCPECRPVHAP